MALIINKRNDNGAFETVGRVINGNISSEQLLNIFPYRVWAQQDEERIAARLNNQLVRASVVEDDDVEPIDNPVVPDRNKPHQHNNG